jgi:hypothetical protein
MYWELLNNSEIIQFNCIFSGTISSGATALQRFGCLLISGFCAFSAAKALLTIRQSSDQNRQSGSKWIRMAADSEAQSDSEEERTASSHLR